MLHRFVRILEPCQERSEEVVKIRCDCVAEAVNLQFHPLTSFVHVVNVDAGLLHAFVALCDVVFVLSLGIFQDAAFRVREEGANILERTLTFCTWYLYRCRDIVGISRSARRRHWGWSGSP